MFTLVASRRKRYPLEGDGTLERHFNSRLFDAVSIGSTQSNRATAGRSRRTVCGSSSRYAVEIALDLGDAVISWKQPLAQ